MSLERDRVLQMAMRAAEVAKEQYSWATCIVISPSDWETLTGKKAQVGSGAPKYHGMEVVYDSSVPNGEVAPYGLGQPGGWRKFRVSIPKPPPPPYVPVPRDGPVYAYDEEVGF